VSERHEDSACKKCESEGIECTWDAPIRRRGPPKGYLQLVEMRMHELEAVLGVLLSHPDPHHRQILSTLCQDAFANGVITNVANGPFGPRALAQYAIEHQNEMNGVNGVVGAGAGVNGYARGGKSGGKAEKDNNSNLGGPTNAWQVRAVRSLVNSSRAASMPPPAMPVPKQGSSLYYFPSPASENLGVNCSLPAVDSQNRYMNGNTVADSSVLEWLSFTNPDYFNNRRLPN